MGITASEGILATIATVFGILYTFKQLSTRDTNPKEDLKCDLDILAKIDDKSEHYARIKESINRDILKIYLNEQELSDKDKTDRRMRLIVGLIICIPLFVYLASNSYSMFWFVVLVLLIVICVWGLFKALTNNIPHLKTGKP